MLYIITEDSMSLLETTEVGGGGTLQEQSS